MPLKERILDDFKTSLKERNADRLSTLKMLRAALANKEIELGKKETGLLDEEIENVIRSEAKKRNDAAEAYTKGGRADLAEKEKLEMAILKEYLPPELSDEEVEKVVVRIIAKMGAVTQKDFGQVMKEVMAELKGKAGGDKVSKKIKEFLSA